jgi:hypothetical protein
MVNVTSEVSAAAPVESATNRGRSRHIFTALALLCIAVVYVVSILRIHPTYLFGLTGDDAIYMSSAKALAEGKGYVLPNLPGSPPATKYPVLYPLILSFVWRLSPSFPANLPVAITISAAFGVGFLLAAYALFSNLGGFGKVEALILTAYCALHPLVAFFGGSVLSDMPFASVALASMLIAERVMRANGTQGASVGCGIMAGISALMRILGFPIILGILVTGLVRRSWRQIATFGMSAAPFVGLAAWNAIFAKRPPSPIIGPASLSLGWTHAWTFYTDYAGIWKLGVPNAHVFWAMLKNNAGMMLRLPADLILGPTFVRDTMVGRVLILLTAVVTIAGILRQGKAYGAKPIHYCLVFSAPVLFLWNYPDITRFFLAFCPLLVAGAWFEGRRVLSLARSGISAAVSMREKSLGFAVGFTVVVFVCGAVENSFGGLRAEIERKSEERHALLLDKKECYDWIRRNTDPTARLLAYEDATAYLFTGRQTVRPMIFTTDEFYDPERLEEASSHFSDVARAIDARFWLFAADDLDGEWPGAKAIEQDHIQRLEGGLPVAFRATGGTVIVRSVDCLANDCQVECDACEPSQTARQLVGTAVKLDNSDR